MNHLVLYVPKFSIRALFLVRECQLTDLCGIFCTSLGEKLFPLSAKRLQDQRFPPSEIVPPPLPSECGSIL